ncbi:hypothetical protein [Pseudomonas protegens]|uniref:hypothetical protein n=1 Tax=Pseudomonas protegens TaxID=380021 RepID=UPI000F464681|nr:hypothetical protein [Pseudomonas protegens]MDP9504562.1 hypothetical protein [Pseudomonas protegens]
MDQLVVTLIVILLPGIIAAIVFDKITSHTKWGSFKFVLYALVLGVVCYSCLQVLCWLGDILKAITGPLEWSTLAIWNSALSAAVSLKASEIFGAVLFSGPVAFLASYLVSHKTFNKLAGWLGVSYKFGDENLFSYFMNGQDVEWVYIRDREAELTYEGLVISFAENGTCHEVVLGDVKVYRYQTSEFLYSVDTIYLCKVFGSLVVESVSAKEPSDE